MPTEHEDHPWTREIPGHPQRADSPEYVRSRKLMQQLAERSGQFYGPGAWQDHHGGGLWAFEGDEPEGRPFLVLNLCGIEWSAQFGADPGKVDQLRVNARSFYEGFPVSAHSLGIRELLDTPITDAAGVERWTDSICNASVPLPAAIHTGTLESDHPSAGRHHYPAPVQEIPLFAYDDLQVFVTDQQGLPVAVAPVGKRGSGDGRVAVEYAHPNSAYHDAKRKAEARGTRLVLPADHPLARDAFARQS